MSIAKPLVLIVLLLSALPAQLSPARLMPAETPLYVVVDEPARLLSRLKRGGLFASFSDLLPDEVVEMIDHLETLPVTRAALGYGPRRLFQPPLLILALETNDAATLRDALPVLLDESGVAFTETGRFFVLTLGRRSKTLMEKTMAGDRRSLEESRSFQRFQEEGRGAALGFLADLKTLRTRAASERILEQDGAALFLLAPLLHHLATAARVHGFLSVEDGLRLEATFEGPSLPSRFAFAGSSAGGAPCLASPPGSMLRLSLRRDLAAFWSRRKEIVPPSGQADLAEFQNQIALFTGGLPVEEAAAALGSVMDIHLALLPTRNSRARPPYPTGALVIPMEETGGFGTELQLAFQTLLGVINADRAQNARPRLLIETTRHRGVLLQTAGFPPSQLPEPDDARLQVRPSMAVVRGRVIIGSHESIVRALVDAALDGRFQDRPPGDSLHIEGRRAHEQLSRLLDLFVARTVLDEGIPRAEAHARLSRILSALEGIVSLDLSFSGGERGRLMIDVQAPGLFFAGKGTREGRPR